MENKKRTFESFLFAWCNKLIIDDHQNIKIIFQELNSSLPERKNSHDAMEKRIAGLLSKDKGIVGRIRRDPGYTDKIVISATESAIEAVFGWREGYCEDRCFWRRSRRDNLREDLFNPNNHISCLECDQLSFRNNIKGLIDSGKIVGVEGLVHRLHEGRELVVARYTEKGDVKLLKPGKPMKMSGGNHPPNHFKHAVERYMSNLAYYALGEFIQERGVSKLAICDNCNEIYPKKKDIKNQRWCGTKCKDAHHNKEAVRSGKLRKYKQKRRAESDCPESYW